MHDNEKNAVKMRNDNSNCSDNREKFEVLQK